MSTSPTHYYASRRNSRDASRPSSPPTPAEVRSQAIAKLKRAASLPRTPGGKRAGSAASTPDAGPSNLTPTYASLSYPIAKGDGSPSYKQREGEEVLSPSPVQEFFNHAQIYASPPGHPGVIMQRSASASSSYHMPMSHLSPYISLDAPYSATSPSPSHTPDWAAMQLAQTYLPSLSPAGVSMPPSSYNASGVQGIGRNSPSPLPTLGELRTLSRSNSNAARAQAMSKLTGGRNTPASEEDHANRGKMNQPGLQRADSLGGNRLLGASQPASRGEEHQAKVEGSSLAVARPRLQRSFTVSSTNMGEERRSAVGRRMVAQLGKRREAREQEEDEVRKLWEERRAAADEANAGDEEVDGTHLTQIDSTQANPQDQADAAPLTSTDHRDEVVEHDDIPSVQRFSPNGRSDSIMERPQTSEDTLGVPDRSISRGTMRSADEAFEYEAHLRRSLSSRTARGAVGTANEAIPKVEASSSVRDSASDIHGDDQEEMHEHSIHQALEPLPLPQPPFATPSTSRHTPNASTSTQNTIKANHSPGESVASRDALGSMMFVMGGTSANAKTADNWPSEVDDHTGSEWGTPAKDLHQPTFADLPLARSPIAYTPDHEARAQQTPHSPYESQGPTGDSTPSGPSQRASVMSWEEVGGPEDQVVPIDPRYHKKSGSISAKIGRNIRTAMRKRSQSKSSVSSNGEGAPTSPNLLSAAIQNFSRRDSETSLSPSQASTAKSGVRGSPDMHGDHVRHQPSVSSLSPSLPSQPESSANSALLQHQLSAEASPVGWLPRADLNDPRIHSSKLSPFPGMATLERKLPGDTGYPDVPKLLHQSSDSAVPSQQRVSDQTTVDSTYSLPLPTASPSESKRSSTDSIGKRNWLAKAFAQSTSSRTSGGMMRRGSSSDGHTPLQSRRPSIPVFDNSGTVEPDPFAAPLTPSQGTQSSASRRRPSSPSVSVVPEDSEEGSRLTTFTAHTSRMETSPASTMEQDKATMGVAAVPQVNQDKELSEKSKVVLKRMDELLDMGPDDPARPDILDDPPRKLLLATQILQVVNAHTAKDRFLFLFNDILVITKPVINQGVTATLDMKFHVKSIVSLDKLHVSGFEDEAIREPPRHAVVQSFIEQFAEDPVAACKYLVERSHPRVDAVTLASLIFKTPELDRTQIGLLLSGNDRLMRAFIDRFHFSGVRIDNALRMFLLAVRLPSDPTAAETLLRGFAHRYFEANRDIISYSRELAEDLVLWIMQLNDTLYGMYGFALPNHAITFDIVILAFQSKDPHSLVHPSLLSDIYASLQSSRVDQALSADEEKERGREIKMSPAKLPSKMTYNTWSEEITIGIEEKDGDFQIRLLGEGLEFEPALLDFTNGREQKFRVKGLSLGTKSILFDRIGSNAALYAAIGNNRTLTVERAFMRYTFQVAFTSHLGLKRKYCFSVSEQSTHQKWSQALQRQVAATIETKKPDTTHPRAAVRQAAEIVSFQVLRDALIPKEENPSMQGANASTNGRVAKPQRSGSVSVAYPATQGRSEMELGPLVPGRAGHNQVQGSSQNSMHGEGEQGGAVNTVKAEGTEKEDCMGGMVDVQSGKELVLLCRQNSLLPGVLELLQSGLPTGPAQSGQMGHAEQAGRNVNRGMGTGMGKAERAMSKRGGGGRV